MTVNQDRPKDFDQLLTHFRDHLQKRLVDENDDWDDLVGTFDDVVQVRRALSAAAMDLQADLSSRRDQRTAYLQECHADTFHGKSRWLLYDGQYGAWRARTTEQMRRIQERLTWIKPLERDLRHTHAVAVADRDQADTRKAVKAVTLAIYRHQLEVTANYEPTPADETLWAVLEAVTIPDNGEFGKYSLMDLLEMRWAGDT